MVVSRWAPCATGVQAQAATVHGAGARFPSKLCRSWPPACEGSPGVKVATARAVPVGTDPPLSPQKLSKHRLVQIPTAVRVVRFTAVKPPDGALLNDLKQ